MRQMYKYAGSKITTGINRHKNTFWCWGLENSRMVMWQHTEAPFTQVPDSATSLLPLPHEWQRAGYKRKVIPHCLLGQHRSHTGWARTHNGSHSSTMHWKFYEDSSVSVRICQKWDVTLLESNDVHKSMFRKMCLQWHMQNLRVWECTSTSV